MRQGVREVTPPEGGAYLNTLTSLAVTTVNKSLVTASLKVHLELPNSTGFCFNSTSETHPKAVH